MKMLKNFTKLSFAILGLYINSVVCVAIDSKLELPEPTSGLVSDQDVPILDSSLSPKIIKAFYEINFVPVANKPEKSKPGYIAIQNGKNCPYSKELCKYLYFVPTKVSTVQEIEDLIKETKESGEVPVVKGDNNVVNIDEFMKEVDKTIGDQVNKKVSTTSEVPVYKGVVNTESVLMTPEKPEYHRTYPSYPYGPYYPPPHVRSEPSTWSNTKPWHESYPRPCIHAPCRSWKSSY